MNILICGKDSYVGKSLIKNLGDKHSFTELDMRNSDWESFDFSGFDAIIFLAAIVHQPKMQDASLYKYVNEELPVLVANRAVSMGVKQFVFFSTMGVYGVAPSLEGGQVSIHTPLSPVDLYGKSKLNAEIELVKLQMKENIILNIVRPPNIYGENCPGNYYSIMQLIAKNMFLFPRFRHNQFSMISIENLSQEIDDMLSVNKSGLLCPQDKGSKSNSVRIASLAKHYKRLHIQSSFLGKLLLLFYRIYPLKQITNFFGDMYYDDTLEGIIDLDTINYPPKTIYDI